MQSQVNKDEDKCNSRLVFCQCRDTLSLSLSLYIYIYIYVYTTRISCLNNCRGLDLAETIKTIDGLAPTTEILVKGSGGTWHLSDLKPKWQIWKSLDGHSWDTYNWTQITKSQKHVFQISGDVFFDDKKRPLRGDTKLTKGLKNNIKSQNFTKSQDSWFGRHSQRHIQHLLRFLKQIR